MCTSPVILQVKNTLYGYDHYTEVESANGIHSIKYKSIRPSKDPLGLGVNCSTKPIDFGAPECKYNKIQVSCGKCPECVDKIVKDWSFRIWQDIEYTHSTAYFLTLTYDDKHLPVSTDRSVRPIDYRYPAPNPCFHDDIDKETGEVIVRGRMKYYGYCRQGFLNYPDVQLFLKRLRKIVYKYYGTKLRFFLRGEYGKDGLYIDDNGRLRRGTCRPHYHAIVWFRNTDKMGGYSRPLTLKQREKFRSGASMFGTRVPKLNTQMLTHIIHKLWTCGKQIDCSRVRSVKATAMYISKYILKAKNAGSTDMLAPNCVPMFGVCSQGISSEWCDHQSRTLDPDKPLYKVYKGLYKGKKVFTYLPKYCINRIYEHCYDLDDYPRSRAQRMLVSGQLARNAMVKECNELLSSMSLSDRMLRRQQKDYSVKSRSIPSFGFHDGSKDSMSYDTFDKFVVEPKRSRFDYSSIDCFSLFLNAEAI